MSNSLVGVFLLTFFRTYDSDVSKLNHMTKESYPILNFQGILELPKRITEKIKYSRSLPKNHLVGDVFLVSYPKSGNTWLRFLIANAIKVHYQVDQEVNFFSILSIIPEVRSSKNIGQVGPFGRMDIPRIIKSHSAYNPYFDRVILLVRDPRYVMLSHYYYLINIKQLSSSTKISEFIRSQKYGVENWKNHTQSWCFNQMNNGQITKTFRYEDFLNNPNHNLLSIMECFGINLTQESVEQALFLSSKERMKDLESKYRNHPFMVRQAVDKVGKDLSKDDQKFIEDYTRDIAQLLGYEF